MSQLARRNRDQHAQVARQAAAPTPEATAQDTYGNDALVSELGRGPSGEMTVRAHGSADGNTAATGSLELRDGGMVGAGVAQKKGKDRTHGHVGFGVYEGEAGTGLQGRVGGGAVRDGNGLSGTLRLVGADEGLRAEGGVEAAVTRGGNTAKLGVSLGGGVTARVEHDQAGAFLVVGADAEAEVTGALAAKAGGVGAGVSLGGALGGSREVRRRLDGLEAAQVEAAIAEGDHASVLTVLGPGGLATLHDAAVSPVDVAQMQVGESVQVGSTAGSEVGVNGSLGVAAKGSTGRDSGRDLRIERTADGVAVTVTLTASDEAKMSLGVATGGFGASGFMDQGQGATQTLSVVLDPSHEGFAAQLDALTAATTPAELMTLSAQHPGSVLTGVASTSEGWGATANVGAVEGSVRMGTTTSDQLQQVDGQTERTRSVTGGAEGKLSLGDRALTMGGSDSVSVIERDGELHALTIRLGESTLRLTPDEAATLLEAASRTDVIESSLHNPGADYAQVLAGHEAITRTLPEQLAMNPELQARLGVLLDHSANYPNAVLPMLDNVAQGAAHIASDDLGSRTEWPESARPARLVYARLMQAMPTVCEQGAPMEQLLNLQRDVDRVEQALDTAEFTDGRARLDMLEQVFVWRSELAGAERAQCEQLTEVEVAEARAGDAARELDRLVADARNLDDWEHVSVAVDVWRAERHTLRDRYRQANVPQEEWRTAPEGVGRELDPSMADFVLVGSRLSPWSTNVSRWQ